MNMYSLGLFRNRSRVLINLLRCKLCQPQFRILSTSHPLSKYKFKPVLNDPEKDIEWAEPGCREADEALIEIPTKKQLKESIKILKSEFGVWKKELKDRITDNVDMVFIPDEIYKIYSFDEEGTLGKWSTVCDADDEIGYSSCSLTQSPNGYAIFSGNLSTKIPLDGKTCRSGFCTALGPRAMKSFNRKSYYEWAQFTHIVFKVRGDGRQYSINISTEGLTQLSWHNLYSYPLYTRGGPYWQLTKIPFSKFIFGSKGYIQDTQEPIPLDDVAWVGIALSDDIDGPFKLEIEYIGLENMMSHVEKHAYETYNFDNYFSKP